MKSKLTVAVAVCVVVGAAVVLLNRSYHFFGGHGRVVDALIARNIEARGGADVWRAVDSLRLTGKMDLGQGLSVPYTMDQKRPGRMCLEFEFDDENAIQCVSEGTGWKLLPFLGRDIAEPMKEREAREMVAMAEIDGLLFDSVKRGHKIELVGNESIDGRETVKLEVTLPGGAKRWVYLDTETALEVKMDATRKLRGEEKLVETFFYLWEDTDGLLIPRFQETQTEGIDDKHYLTVDSVTVNPPIDDPKFDMPEPQEASASVASGSSSRDDV
jgi:hypothetical protein